MNRFVLIPQGQRIVESHLKEYVEEHEDETVRGLPDSYEGSSA
jgi:hypothetical protein